MDLKPRTPLPPGMVPSASREDMSSIIEEEERMKQQEPKSIVQEGSFGGTVTPESTPKVGTGLAAPGIPPEAWKAASEERNPETYHIDLSGNDDDNMDAGTDKVPVYKGISTPELGKTPRRKLWSPFSRSKDKVKDLREEVLARGESFTEQQPTARRILSPLKSNKVAPSPNKPQPSPASKGGLTFTPSSLDTTLQNNGAKLLDSPPSKNSVEETSGACEVKPSTAKQEDPSQTKEREPLPTLTPIIVVKSKEGDYVIKDDHARNEDTAVVASPVNVEPLYSSVVKPKPKAKRVDNTHTQESDLITELPKLETYEPPSVLDTSLVVTNPSAQSESRNEQIDYSSADDHAYEMVDSPNLDVPDMPVYSASVYKELKKHQDTGNVHLISVKGTAPDLMPKSQTMNFPEGSSADMYPLHYAAASGDKKELAKVLSILPIVQDPVEMVLGTEKMCSREGLEVCDSEGRTPIMHAVHNNHLQSVKMLAEVGANVNALANDGSTSLHQAAYSGSLDMVALLLSLGADGLKKDNEGRTPLHWCTNNTEPTSIEIILDKVPGLSVDVRDGALMTPLMWAAFHGHQEHVIKLIERGANPQLTDIDGMTAVHWSVQRHDTRTLQVLINTESASYQDNKGKTVMHQAAERGSAKAVSLIKAVKPTSVNDQDNNGRTPLHWASVCENPEVIRALLAHGANTSMRDYSGFTANDYANQKNLHYCALLLSESEGSDETDSYQSIPTYGATTATFGARALQQQERQLLDVEDVKKMLTQEQILQIQTVCRGSWIHKFSNEGKGPTHPRFFWVNPSNVKICWAKEKDANSKDTKSDILVGVRSSASPAVFSRKDFDPMNKHKYSFTIFTSSRVLDVVALSSDDYKMWLNGLQLLLQLGSVNATRLLSLIQSSSGGEPKPIP